MNKKPSSTPPPPMPLRLFYPKISSEELRGATSGFSSDSVIGSGKFGTVYKGVLGPGEIIVAVKVLDLQQHGAPKCFMAECRALRYIRHRNLVRALKLAQL